MGREVGARAGRDGAAFAAGEDAGRPLNERGGHASTLFHIVERERLDGLAQFFQTLHVGSHEITIDQPLA